MATDARKKAVRRALGDRLDAILWSAINRDGQHDTLREELINRLANGGREAAEAAVDALLSRHEV